MTVEKADTVQSRWRSMRDMFLRYEAILTQFGHTDEDLIEACRDLAAAFEAAPSNPAALEQPDLAAKWDRLRAFMSMPSVLH